MGAIEMSLGKSEEAIECYKEVFDTDPLDAKAWIMIGQAQAATSEKLTKRSYEKVLRDCDKNDLYTHVALGNYHAAAAREFKTDKQKELRKNSYQLAVNFYSQALRRDPNNVYAANGLAITIAENDHVEQARDLFTQVREAAVSNSSVWANLAHVYVELKQYKQAIVMVRNTNKNISIILFTDLLCSYSTKMHPRNSSTTRMLISYFVLQEHNIYSPSLTRTLESCIKH